jgi:hypothetical protein
VYGLSLATSNLPLGAKALSGLIPALLARDRRRADIYRWVEALGDIGNAHLVI